MRSGDFRSIATEVAETDIIKNHEDDIRRAGGGDYRLGPYGLGVVDRFADPRRWSALCLFHGDL